LPNFRIGIIKELFNPNIKAMNFIQKNKRRKAREEKLPGLFVTTLGLKSLIRHSGDFERGVFETHNRL
jgi:hypothetical protein